MERKDERREFISEFLFGSEPWAGQFSWVSNKSPVVPPQSFTLRVAFNSVICKSLRAYLPKSWVFTEIYRRKTAVIKNQGQQQCANDTKIDDQSLCRTTLIVVFFTAVSSHLLLKVDLIAIIKRGLYLVGAPIRILNGWKSGAKVESFSGHPGHQELKFFGRVDLRDLFLRPT